MALPPSNLPIEAALPALRAALRSSTCAVLQAPPGAGKTTRVPLALLEEPWASGDVGQAGRIVVLEPRRLAARAAASYMARLLGEDVGGIVGYRVRMDTRVSARTRVEVVTEGVLTRMLQSDPALEGVAAVVFDEFHERSLHADLGLALTLDAQGGLRPDLRVLVMSATLDGAAVAALLGGAAGPASVVATQGRSWPVETRHLKRPLSGAREGAVARTVVAALSNDGPSGDILVFLPGAAEIHRVEAALSSSALPPRTRVYPLYGNLPRDVQDRAIAPAPVGERKVVLATSIAETSLTIEGVRIVVDSGLMRVPRFDARTGMTRLVTVPVSRASADQRRGRAGRLGPGICYRLWTAGEESALLPRGVPEILEADLAPVALELAAWGVGDPGALRWLDQPPAATFSQARQLLAELGALDASGALTEHGRRMAAVPLHPRLAHMVLRGAELGLGALATELAALLSERDILRVSGGGSPGGGGAGPLPRGAPGGGRLDADVRIRLDALARLEAGAWGGAPRTIEGASLDMGAARRALAEARQWRRTLRIPESPAVSASSSVEAAGLLLALAYPDRIAQRRTGQIGRFVLRNGRGAALDEDQPLARADWMVAADLDGEGRESRVFLAAPLALEDLERHFGDQVTEDTTVGWDEASGAVRARRRRRLGALVLQDAPAEAEDEEIERALLEHIRARGAAALPWSKEAARLRERLAFLHRLEPDDWPDVSDEALTAALEEWLAPFLRGVRSRQDLERVDLQAALLARMDWERRRALDRLAPTHVDVPSGSRIPIDYSDPDAPVLAVRLQEMFGLADTPRIGGGRVPLTLHLLSPAHRPVQVTRDLASFWRDAYFEVRKDLKGRYPKHHWPDDPMAATPTRRAKRRGEH